MSNVAKKFLQELQNGDQTQAIETIKESLRENAYQKIEESRKEILESYGFVSEAKIKVGDKVEIGHQDPNTSEVSFKGDTSVGEVVQIKGNRVLVADSSGDVDWSDMGAVRKMNESLDESMLVDVSVKDATKANDIAKDMFRGEYKTDGSNSFVFKKKGAMEDFVAELKKQNIEVMG